MRKLSKWGYRLALAAAAGSAALATLFGLITAITGNPHVVGIALLFVGLALVCVPVVVHFHLREVVRILKPRTTLVPPPPVVLPAPGAEPVPGGLEDAVRELTQNVQMSRNNELHLLDAVQSLQDRLGTTADD